MMKLEIIYNFDGISGIQIMELLRDFELGMKKYDPEYECESCRISHIK